MRKLTSNSTCLGKHKWIAICIVVCASLVITACSCNVTLPPSKASPFERTWIVSCKDVEMGNPKSVTDVFTDQDQQVCVFVRGEFEDSAAELFAAGEQIDFTFAWYYEGQAIVTNMSAFPVTSDMQVVASDCLLKEESLSQAGQYLVIVKQGNVKIGEVEFKVE